MRENKTCLNQGWNQLPTEELDQILQAELEKDHPNEEVVLPILHELEEREKDYPVERTPEVLTILDQYSKHETISKQSKNRRGWIAGIAALAAVICIVVMAVPQTAGAENIIDVLFRWTESVFEFFTPGQDADNPPVDIAFQTDNPGLQQLYDKVTEYGVKDPVVPMWLPEGFTLLELRVLQATDGQRIFGKFDNGGKDISITYLLTTNITTKFEKEDSAVEVYDYADVSHFVLANEDNLSVMWIVDNVECSVVANVQKNDVYKIIKSIYRRRLQ